MILDYAARNPAPWFDIPGVCTNIHNWTSVDTRTYYFYVPFLFDGIRKNLVQGRFQDRGRAELRAGR